MLLKSPDARARSFRKMRIQFPLRRFTYAVLVLLLAGLGFAYALASVLIAPASHPVGPLPPDLPGESVLIPSDSGSSLHGWFIHGQQDAVVLMHGVRAARASQVDRARLFHAAGYAVLLFDFQAHGESPGEHITFGYLERLDAQAAVAYVRHRLPGQRIAVVGQSLGGAAALLAQPSLPIDALVAEAVYPDLASAISNRLQRRFGQLASLCSPLLTLQVRPRLGFDLDALRPIDRVAELGMPKLFIAGRDDSHTTIQESRRLYAASAAPKSLWVVDGAAHQDFYAYAPAEYRRRVLHFLAESLGH